MENVFAPDGWTTTLRPGQAESGASQRFSFGKSRFMDAAVRIFAVRLLKSKPGVNGMACYGES
jgi:hypothetical protein